jgi:hypothetical protein
MHKRGVRIGFRIVVPLLSEDSLLLFIRIPAFQKLLMMIPKANFLGLVVSAAFLYGQPFFKDFLFQRFYFFA